MINQSNARLYAKIEGRVQGVGFRMFVLDKANALGVTGWVRNTIDGLVEVNAEGSRQVLEFLLVDLRRGPNGAYVTQVQQDWQVYTGEFTHFEVRRTV
jgi:acylphosphatase